MWKAISSADFFRTLSRENNTTAINHSTPPLSQGCSTCSQCEPETSTYAFDGEHYEGFCTRINVHIENIDSPRLKRVLCIGKSGAIKWCQAGEFLAVSHVRSHGWQGARKDGVCSRVLEMLLKIAREGFELDWIWLDVALNTRSSDPAGGLSYDEFNWIYANAKCTLVWDKLLLTTNCRSPLEKSLALSKSEWYTRLWTMREAMLTKELWVMQRNYGHWSVNRLLSDLIAESQRERGLGGDFYEAIQDVSAILCCRDTQLWETLQRVVHAGRPRRARKPLHLLEAVYPMFNIPWDSNIVSFERGHKTLMERLGSVGIRCISLFAPFGIPGPYSWAPVSLVATKGALVSDVRTTFARVASRQSKATALSCSMWLSLKVKLDPETLELQVGSFELENLLPLLDHEALTYRLVFSLEDYTTLQSDAYLSPTEPFPWTTGPINAWLWLLRPREAHKNVGNLRHYVVGRLLGVIETIDGERLSIFRKIGVVECSISDSRLVESEIYATWADFNFC
jgi:hypothetical protein